MPAMPRRGAAASAVRPPHTNTRHKTEQDDSSRDVFRRHFESVFAPLPLPLSRPGPGSEAGRAESASQEDLEVDVDTDFEGLSEADDGEDDENPVVEVVDHSGPGPGAASDPREGIMTKETLKSFMSSRPPPTTGSTPRPHPATSAKSSALPEDSAELIAKDVELQRLLAESHLLLRHQTDHPILSSASGAGAAAAAGSVLFASGRARLRATDMRLGALGASGSSLYARPRTARPVALALVAASAAREKKRRREARETGVVLERKGGKTGPGAKMAKRKSKKGGR